jgi:hypothetical protein
MRAPTDYAVLKSNYPLCSIGIIFGVSERAMRCELLWMKLAKENANGQLADLDGPSYSESLESESTWRSGRDFKQDRKSWFSGTSDGPLQESLRADVPLHLSAERMYSLHQNSTASLTAVPTCSRCICCALAREAETERYPADRNPARIASPYGLGGARYSLVSRCNAMCCTVHCETCWWLQQ